MTFLIYESFSGGTITCLALYYGAFRNVQARLNKRNPTLRFDYVSKRLDTMLIESREAYPSDGFKKVEFVSNARSRKHLGKGIIEVRLKYRKDQRDNNASYRALGRLANLLKSAGVVEIGLAGKENKEGSIESNSLLQRWFFFFRYLIHYKKWASTRDEIEKEIENLNVLSESDFEKLERNRKEGHWSVNRD